MIVLSARVQVFGTCSLESCCPQCSDNFYAELKVDSENLMSWRAKRW